jgi:hypothetical protein
VVDYVDERAESDRVPERTTPRQRMIAIVREHLAQPGVTVTKSKKLFDQAAGKLREVDVVAEGDLDGDSLIVSVEVIDRGRPATLTWVEEMLGKHMTLPTNKLVLVSWSGFSEAALAKVTAVPGAVAVTPTPVLESDATPRESEALYVDQIALSPERVKATVRLPDGSTRDVAVADTTAIYDEDGEEAGSMGEAVGPLLRSEGVGRRLSMDAHGREDRDDLKWFTVGIGDIDQRVRAFLRHTETEPPELHQIIAVEIIGRFSWQQTELRFAVVDIDGRAHGIAQAPMFGKDAVWVATPKGDDSNEVKLSWRAIGPANLDRS